MKTYGHLELCRISRKWRIQKLAPHVAIAFKRLFPRVPTTATIITLSDTDEIRADLEWFMLRFPLDHDEAKEIAAGAARLATKMAERERILLPTWTPGPVVGFREGKAPYLYQSQAATIAIGNPSQLIGDDVGLGKTISAAAAFTGGAPMPAGVVVQAHLKSQWKKRLEEFTHLRVHVIKGTTPYDLPPADVYIWAYSNIAGWVNLLHEGFIKTIAYDEIQELRHGQSTNKGIAAMVASKKAEVRIGLTATPVYNYGDEIHQVMEYVQPGLLGDRNEFMREWCGNTRIVKDPDALGAFLRDAGYFLRRTEDDDVVDVSMPPPNIVDWEVDFDQSAVDDEEAIMRKLAQSVLRGGFVEAGQAARELDLKMRQLTGIGKARSVAAYVKMLLRDAPRVLLAGWHREVYDIWKDALSDFNPVLYTGSETAAGKDRSVERFTIGDSRVMFISLRSGAGLDGLQYYCNQVVLGELDWSPQVHKQVIGRWRRPGQEEQITAHYLHANGGSDPVILEMLGLKSDQARGINDPGLAQPVKFSDDSRIKKLAQFVLDGGLVDA